MSHTIRILLVDDSPFICRLMAAYLKTVPGLEVAGMAFDGAHALELVGKLRPDVISLDLEMPGMGGLEVLERIVREVPTPVVVVTGVGPRSAATTLQALRLGAVDFILKYAPGVDTDPGLLQAEIASKLRLAARVKVIRSLPAAGGLAPGIGREPWPAAPGRTGSAGMIGAAVSARRAAARPLSELLIIGASTGGPVALRELLGALPADFPAAVVVVQHLPATFTQALAVQLDRQIALPVQEAMDGDHLHAGQVLVAPGDFDLLVRPNARVELVAGARGGGPCPSIDATMQSAAAVYGPNTVGVVLTGMGRDGALGLSAIRSRGGRTFAQDAATCVVNGMPQQAVDLGVVDRVASPAKIADLLLMPWSQVLEKQTW